MKSTPDVHEGGEGWLISYCDMITLLVTFFLMMLTFSSKNYGDVSGVAVGLLRGRGGIFPNLSGYMPKPPPGPASIGEVAKRIAQMSKGSPERSIGLIPHADGLTLRFDESCSFAPGSDTMNATLREQLTGVGEALRGYEHLVVIEGFADGAVSGTREPYELSAARALAAARLLVEGASLPADRVQFSGLGDERPRATENTAVARSLNRRVEIRVTALQRSAADVQPKEAR
jgi:chemotaxis protein MotB